MCATDSVKCVSEVGRPNCYIINLGLDSHLAVHSFVGTMPITASVGPHAEMNHWCAALRCCTIAIM